MINENALRNLLLDDEARRWHREKIACKNGFLYDWDGYGWTLERKNYRCFLKYLLAMDLQTRDEYLRKRRQNDAADEPDANFDEAFLTAYLAESCKREKDFARKAAAIYFAWNDDLRAWFQNIWLNADSDWIYDSKRDDVFLAEILANDDFRVKTPDVVQKICCEWCLQFLGSLTYRIAHKKYGYQPEEFFRDVYQRLFGRDGRRKNAKNAIDFWRKETPTNSLCEWVELETLRELERALKQRQRAYWAATFLLSGDLSFVEKTTTKDGNSTPIDNVQTLFDRFHAASPSDAVLLAAYWSSNITFEELARFWNVGDPEKKATSKTWNKRYERALDRFREVCERISNVEIPKERWGKVVKIFLKSAAQSNETNAESETSARLRGTGKNGRRVRVRFITEPSENDKELLLRVLEAKRIDETGFFLRLLRQKFQGGGFDTNVAAPVPVRRVCGSQTKERAQDNRLGDFRRSDVPVEEDAQSFFLQFQRPPGICGSPVNNFDSEAVRLYWRNKISNNDAVVLYFESATDAPSAPTYWRAEARIPLFAASSDAEVQVPVFFGGYNPLVAAPCSLTLGEKTTPILYGVAVVALADFRGFIEAGELPRVTVLQRRVDDGKRRTRWHVKSESKTRLLLQKPVVPDKEG